MRTVVSVSMDPEMATRLKSSAAEGGQSFSARVCELIKSGLEFERLDTGLFAQTEEDSVEQGVSEAEGSYCGEQADPDPVLSPEGVRSAPPAEQIQSDDGTLFRWEAGEKSGTDRGPSDTGSEPESLLPSDRSDVIDSGNEDQPESRRDDPDKAPLGTGPEDEDAGGARSASPSPAEGEVFTGTVAERVYALVTADRISVKELASRASVSEVDAGAVLERLIDEDGEPIVLGRMNGEWFCWLES